MSDHPAVTWLRQELDRAERVARDAADGDGGQWFVGDKWNVYRVEDRTPRDDTESNRLVVYGNVERQSRHIAAHDPASVLRRVAKTREILAEHAPDGPRAPDCVRCADEGRDVEIGGGFIETLRDAQPYPCRTVLLLAESWGWEQP